MKKFVMKKSLFQNKQLKEENKKWNENENDNENGNDYDNDNENEKIKKMKQLKIQTFKS